MTRPRPATYYQNALRNLLGHPLRKVFTEAFLGAFRRLLSTALLRMAAVPALLGEFPWFAVGAGAARLKAGTLVYGVNGAPLLQSFCLIMSNERIDELIKIPVHYLGKRID